MKIIYISLLMMLSSFTGLFAQGISKENIEANPFTSKSLFFNYGQAYNLKLDRTYSRVAKNGFNHLFYLGFEHLNNKRMIDVQSSFMIGTLKTKGNNVNIINNYAGSLKLGYLKNIENLRKNNVSVYAGVNLKFRSDFWFPRYSDLRYAWDMYLGTEMAISVRYKINPKLSFQYDLDFSLLGVLWRSHNNGQQLITEEIQLENGIIASALEIPRFSHIFNTLYIDNSFKLFHTVSKKIKIYYNFAVSYRHIKQPLVKKGYEFNNAIGIVYKF